MCLLAGMRCESVCGIFQEISGILVVLVLEMCNYLIFFRILDELIILDESLGESHGAHGVQCQWIFWSELSMGFARFAFFQRCNPGV